VSEVPTFILEELDPVDRPDLQYKGVSYPAALPDDFGLDTEAKVKRLLTQLQTWQDRPDNQQKARKLESFAGDIIEIYFPTMPVELRDKIPFMKKLDIIRWWGEVVYPPRMDYLREIRRLRQEQIA
jgi:hypothetical protein